MELLNDRWLRLIGIPATVLLSNLLFLDLYQDNPWAYINTSLLGIAYTTLLWLGLRWWLLYTRGNYPDVGQTGRRVLLTFAGYVVFCTATPVALWLLVIALARVGVSVPGLHLLQVVASLVSLGTIGLGYELLYYFRKYGEAIQEAEAVKKAGLQNQFDRLKAQVNPHFLFNSLNSLSALISENPRQATAFLDELSSVYRYLLQNNRSVEGELTTLRAELEFMRSYFYLLKTRYGTAIALYREVNEALLDHRLPPLTLQLLVENAVKHNVALPENPLNIRILTTDTGELLVANTIRRKSVRVPSEGLGLANIAHRYRLLGLREPIIDDDGRFFIVRLVLAS